jgi:hypothetical protein
MSRASKEYILKTPKQTLTVPQRASPDYLEYHGGDFTGCDDIHPPTIYQSIVKYLLD